MADHIHQWSPVGVVETDLSGLDFVYQCTEDGCDAWARRSRLYSTEAPFDSGEPSRGDE